MTELFAPEEYWTCTDRSEICNGCGTKGLAGVVIPDSLAGLSIRECCDIHDWMYTFGKTNADKEEADRVFLNNMVRLIDDNHTVEPVMAVRRQHAMIYYSVVRDFGGPAFWKGKNKPEEMGVV
jgi:hypothetical protein